MVEIRTVREEELGAYFESLTTGFLERPDIAAIARDVATLWDLSRVWAAFEGDAVRSTWRSWPSELTVPGGARLPAAAVTSVTVMPTHRRRGILRGMVAADHAASRERGEAVSLLYASEYPIYGRFGYGPAVREATWTIETAATTFVGDPAGGSIEVVTPSEPVRDAVKGVFEAWRVRQPGELRRLDYRWDFDVGLRVDAWSGPTKGWIALHRDAAGEVDGYAFYGAEEKWENRQPRNILKVRELHASTDEAYAALWRFLAEIDWIRTIKAEHRSPAERLPWLLTNSRAAVVSEVGDGLWVRLFDIPRALEARTYEGEGSLVLEVVDAEAPGGSVRVHLDATPDGASCTPTDRFPDLTLDVSALGSAYMGGVRLRDAVLRAGFDEHRHGSLADADLLFRTLDEPWCSTFF